MLVNYRGRARTFSYVSAANLLGERLADEQIRGKIVFAGTSAAGFKEFRATPVETLMPGVEIHATVVDNILKGDGLSRPAYMRGAEVLIAFLNMLKFWQEEIRSKRRNSDLVQTQAAIIESMASLTETRDPETGRHIKRTQEYVRLLAHRLKHNSNYSHLLSAETIDLLYKSAALHDIGKVGVSDRILLMPGRLTEEEFEEMKKHTVICRDVIAETQKKLGNKAFLKFAREIAFTHHEKWDGSGYPRALKGEQIPLSGRLMAVVDMYKALTTRRVYKPAHSHEEAVHIMSTEERHSFDPHVLEAFLKFSDDFRALAAKYVDPEEKN